MRLSRSFGLSRVSYRARVCPAVADSNKVHLLEYLHFVCDFSLHHILKTNLVLLAPLNYFLEAVLNVKFSF